MYLFQPRIRRSHVSAKPRYLRPIGIFLMSFGLIGCAQMGVQKSSTQIVARDVEAPEILDITQEAIWDGSASLGGIWVSWLERVDPKKVIIRNTSNDSFVIGSLLPGVKRPNGFALQVSQDAATALGMSEGVPSQLKITALVPEGSLRAKTADAAEAKTGIDMVVADTLDPKDKAQSAAVPVPAVTAPAKSAADTALARPYLQIGIFAVQSNYKRAIRAMQKLGLPTSTPSFKRDGVQYWRVLVGPAENTAQRDAYLGKVKKEGFSDAYSVTN